MNENLFKIFSSNRETAEEVINALPMAIFVTDAEGELRHFNSAAVELLGREPDLNSDRWYRSWNLYFPNGDPMPADESPMIVALKENRSIRGEEVYAERPDGECTFFKVYSFPLRNKNEEVTGGINMLVNIEDQKEKLSELRSALEESEQQRRLYEAIVSSTPDLVYVFDLDYRFTFVNDALLEMWGLSREESIGKSLLEIGYEPWHAEMHEREIDQIIDTKEPVHGEVSFPHDKLGERFYDYIFVPILNDEGEVEAVGGITRDVTERKQAEQALRNNEEKYRTLVENFPNGAVGLFDKDLRYTAVGGELVNTVGLDPADRIGNKITDIYPEEIVEEVEPHFRATLAGEANSFEAEFHNRKLFAQTLPIKNEEGEVGSGMLMVLDITERWKAQQALRKSEEKYRTLFETMEEGFCILKLEFDDNDEVEDFRYMEVNSSFKKHTGLKDVKGKKGSEVLQGQEMGWIKIYAQVALTGEPEHFEYYAEELDRWFEISSFRIGEPGEQKVAGLFSDITERKRAQEKLKEMNETLEEQVEERTKSLVSYQNQLRSLVAELSKAEEQERQRLASDLHDNLGQILAMGKMKVTQLKQESIPDSAAESLAELAELIEDALTYTRDLTSDLKPPSSLDKEDLKAHIKWVAKKMEKHDLEVTIEDDEQSKPLNKEVRMSLLQCVRELLFNVIKHASVNEAVVILKRHDEQLQITVKDEGEGFDPDYEELTSDQERGFGLFSIRERVDMLGGKMDIDSEPGRGTSVNLYIPLKDSDPIEEIDSEKSPSPEKSEEIKILLADDQQMFREGLRNIIEKEDDLTVIDEAGNGEEAVEISRENSPDVILMEVNLPGMDAIEATNNILAEDPQIRIIGLTSDDDEELIQDIRNAGATAFLSKNEAFQSLATSIRAEASAQDNYG